VAGRQTDGRNDGASSPNACDPTISAKQSGVGNAVNRFGKLVQKQIRLLTDNGGALVDTTERAVLGTQQKVGALPGRL